MRRILIPTLLLVTALLVVGAAPGAPGRPATAAEAKSMFTAEPFLGLAEKCVPLHIAVEGAFAGLWVTYKQTVAAKHCGVLLFSLENEVILHRSGSTWAPVPGSPPACAAHVPPSLLIDGTVCDARRPPSPVGGFELPSHNIACTATPNDQLATGKPTVTCGLVSGVSDKRWLADECLSPADWVVHLDSALRAHEGCASAGGLIPATKRVLAYGSKVSFGGVTCDSELSGLTCTNANGSGFMLARATQQLFDHPTAGWKPARQGNSTSFSVQFGSTLVASCDLFTGSPSFIRCDGQVDHPKPTIVHHDCDITGLALDATGKGVVNCASDSVNLPGASAPLLPVARPLTVGAFTCTAAAASFMCTTAAGHEIWFGPDHSWRVS